MCCLASKRWDTRTRTKNDRTRICSVTITPYPNACFALQSYYFFRISQTIYNIFFASFYTFYKAEQVCKRVRNNMGKTIIFTIMHS